MRAARVQISFLASAIAALGLAAVACRSPVDEPDSTIPGSCTGEAALLGAIKTDILFVIDNSGSMGEEQAGVAAELPAFIDELKQGAGTAHDFRVGVITTSVYQQGLTSTGDAGTVTYFEYDEQSGRVQPVPEPLPDGGTTAGTDRFIDSNDPQLIQKFSRLIQVGTTGSGQETPFEAVRLAVTDLKTKPIAEGGNAEFFRNGANLLIVVVSDEDDCSEMVRPPVTIVGRDQSRDYCKENEASLVPVDTYANLFKGLDRNVKWAAIAPVSRTTKEAAAFIDNGVMRNVDCPTSFQPGFRHRAMALRFDDTLGNLDSICKGSWRESLLAIAEIANTVQTLEVSNVPDPRLLTVELTRADGTTESCSVAQGEIEYRQLEGGGGYVEFTSACPRRPDDASVQVKMICAG